MKLGTLRCVFGWKTLEKERVGSRTFVHRPDKVNDKCTAIIAFEDSLPFVPNSIVFLNVMLAKRKFD